MFPPARRRFYRTKPLRMMFPPVEGGGRKSLSVGARSKDTPRTDPSTVSCVLLRGTCLRRTPPHYSRSAHQCAGRAVYFAAAKYGKAGRPPGVATLVAVRGLVPSWCIAGSRRVSVIFRLRVGLLSLASKRHPSDGPFRCNVLDAKTQYSSGTSLRCPLDIFAPALPPFPASRYAELVSGGHLPTIAVRGWTAPSLYVFLASLELSFWLATLSSGCIAGSRRASVIVSQPEKHL